MAIGFCEAGFDHKAFTVLHQGMAHMAEPGFPAFALAVEACVGIDNGPMGFVRALLAMEVHLGVAAFAGGFWPVPPEPASPAGGSAPLASALGWRLFIEAQASISVPSTQKCSSDNSGSTALSAGRQRTGAAVFVGARLGRVSSRDPAGGIARGSDRNHDLLVEPAEIPTAGD